MKNLRMFCRVIMLVAVASLCRSCCKTMSDAEASRWVSAFSPALIDKEATIRIELTDLAAIKVDTTRNLDKVFSFSPRMKGRVAVSADRRYVDFLPEKAFREETTYKCRVNLKELVQVETLGIFTFEFQVIERAMRFENLHVAVDADDASMMTLRGTIEYNSTAADTIENPIVCDYPGARIEVDKASGHRVRSFKVSGIRRFEQDKELHLRINPMSGFSAEEFKVPIPSLSGFKLLSADRVEASEPYINLEFSTPLSSQQELDGLITVSATDKLRIIRQGANVKVYGPFQAFPELTLRISGLLKNADGRPLDRDIERHFEQEVIPPAIDLPFVGNILPDNHNLRLPFRAVNLAAVDVEVVKVFPPNLLTFFQSNDIGDVYSLRRYGRLVYHKTVRLDKDRSLDLHRWQDFAIELTDLFRTEPGALYNIRLTFRKAYSLYGLDEAADFAEQDGVSSTDNGIWDMAETVIYRDAPDYDGRKFIWSEADDPTKDSYYMECYERMPEVNLVASDLGLIVKSGSDYDVKATVTNLVTATPAQGVKVTAYNYQLHPVGIAMTDANGFADLKTTGKAAIVTASDGVCTTYLRLRFNTELGAGNFNVGGVKTNDGIKTFVYGDRGVWRPGDEIHLSVIVEDKEHNLPTNHPMEMKLLNPSGQLYTHRVLDGGTDGFYVFNVATGEDVPTGLWHAVFTLGNHSKTFPVRIETIKPNRLKININTPDVLLGGRSAEIGIDANWLTGSSAGNLPVAVEMNCYPDDSPFEKFKNFTFRNPLVSYTTSRREMPGGVLDSLGHFRCSYAINNGQDSPGMLRANITAKVSEPGGDASFTTKSVSLAPFGVYVGIDLGKREFVTDTDIKFPVVVLNQLGAKMKTRQLSYKIYRLDWNWWWEGNASNLNRYVKSTSADIIKSDTITAVNGLAEIPMKIEYPDWGRYLVLVRDIKGGHATGGIIDIDWPTWRGRSDKSVAGGSSELSFTLDKAQYNAGDTAHVYLPQCKGGRVLLSVETGSKVLRRIWVKLSETSDTKFPLVIDRAMAPNFYVTATMLRPHKATDFSTPIRMYGVQGATVVDPRSVLHPVIEMSDELQPHKQFVVKVSERDRRPMSYTLAIVDEGLLDITGFKTPRPWSAMNCKEALGIRSWDMYDDVIGAFGGNFRSIWRVGGDEALRKAAGAEKRFNPAVMFVGPFTTDGSPKSHKLTMPGYVGSVRVMVVAAHKGAYGNADKTVPVKAPLMLLSSLPRVLANTDSVDMAVNVFAMEDAVKKVALNIRVDGPIAVAGSTSGTVSFANPGQKLTNFRLVCDSRRSGKARVIVSASAPGYFTADTTFIEVTNPMPEVIGTETRMLKAGDRVQIDIPQCYETPASIQVSSFPMFNFKGAEKFLRSYPHQCSEQLSSKALFMLYGRRFLDAEGRERCDKNLPNLLKQLQGRQVYSGGYVYWPGQSVENEWVSSMAAVVLAEASRRSFHIDKDAFEKLIAFQQTKAQKYQYKPFSDVTQAFRLYSLAVAGRPERSAMNRLLESRSLSRSAAYCLAAAYAETGRQEVALRLIERAGRSELVRPDDMFHSSARETSIAILGLALCGDSAKALDMARRMASDQSFVTQDLAFATLALNQLAQLVGDPGLAVRITERGKKPMELYDKAPLLDVPVHDNVTVENLKASGTVGISLLTTLKSSADEPFEADSKGLEITVKYTDLSGNPVSVSSLRQNTEFKAVIEVSNPVSAVDNMALTYSVPSGWEIWNDRLNSGTGLSYSNCDLRDSQARFYFALKEGGCATFEVRLRAAYTGSYLLPPTIAEDMYNPRCRANTSGSRVNVTI